MVAVEAGNNVELIPETTERTGLRRVGIVVAKRNDRRVLVNFDPSK